MKMAEEKKQEKIFYSWQIDVLPKDNRDFIEKCLKRAIKTINKEGSIIDELILDRDTKGVPGSPVIAEIILGKIDESALFLADVTIIGRANSGKPVPNPNVLIELGYALKALSHDALILVLNEAYGGIQDLPFDLRHRRIMTYNLPPSVASEREEYPNGRKKAEQELQKDLEKALRGGLNKRPVKLVEPVLSPLEQLEQYLLDPNDARRAARLIDKEIDKLSDALNAISTSDIAKNESPEGVYHLIQAYEQVATDVLALYVRGGYDADSILTESLVKGLTHLMHVSPVHHQFRKPHLYTALYLLYAGGMAALAGKRYITLIALMRQVRIRTPQNPRGYPAAYQLVPYRVIDECIAKRLPPVEHHYTPMNTYLFRVLREPLRPVIKIDAEYEECFYRFEYLFALASAFAEEEYGLSGVAAPVGSYIWEQNLRHQPYIFEATDKELSHQKELWPPFKAGIFDGTFDDFLHYKKQADESIKKIIRVHYSGLNL